MYTGCGSVIRGWQLHFRTLYNSSQIWSIQLNCHMSGSSNYSDSVYQLQWIFCNWLFFRIKYLAQVWKNSKQPLFAKILLLHTSRPIENWPASAAFYCVGFLDVWYFLHVTWLVAPLSRKVLRKFFTQPFSCSPFLWKFS